MTDDRTEELRQLVQTVLDRLDPAVRAAAALAAARDSPGKCQQVWCPVCALAALVNGEHHPLLTLVADHSVSLLDLAQAMMSDVPAASGTAPPEPPPPSSGPGRYQPIPVTVEE